MVTVAFLLIAAFALLVFESGTDGDVPRAPSPRARRGLVAALLALVY